MKEEANKSQATATNHGLRWSPVVVRSPELHLIVAFQAAVRELGLGTSVMRAAIFLALFAVVLAVTTWKSQSGGLGFGTHSFTYYGWPQQWLTVDHRTQTVSIAADGTQEGGERWTERQIHWQQFFVSAGAAVCIAGGLMLSLFVWSRKQKEIE